MFSCEFCKANQWTGFYMIRTSVVKESTHIQPMLHFYTPENRKIEVFRYFRGIEVEHWLKLPNFKSIPIIVRRGVKTPYFKNTPLPFWVPPPPPPFLEIPEPPPNPTLPHFQGKIFK